MAVSTNAKELCLHGTACMAVCLPHVCISQLVGVSDRLCLQQAIARRAACIWVLLLLLLGYGGCCGSICTPVICALHMSVLC
jgi:hypothetical protein